jgi:hypothetical protein
MLRKHAWGLSFALLVGLISVAPTVLAPLPLGRDYRGIQYLPLDDEDIYRARIHEILDGHYAVASPFLYEYKNTSVVAVPPINEWFYALPAFLFGLSAVIVASKFLLPAFLFFFSYLLVRRLLKEEPAVTLTAVVAGLLVAFGTNLMNYQSVIPALEGLAPVNPILWTRLVNPVVGAVEVFAFLYLLLRVWEGDRRFVIPAGAVLALMVGYFFSFGIAASILAVLLLGALAKKEYSRARYVAYIFLLSLVLDAWYWYQTLFSVSGPAGRVLAERNGMSFTHAPVLNKMLITATLFVAASYLYARFRQKQTEYDNVWFFLGTLLLGSWLALNQQIITGREIWYHHFVQYTVPLSLVAIAVASHISWRFAASRVWRFGMYSILGLLLAYGLFSTTHFKQAPAFAESQENAEIMSWLQTNAQKDCVVLVSAIEEVERLIPAYTSCNTYNTSVTFAGVPKERVLHNYLLGLRLRGITRDTVRDYLDSHSTEVRVYFFDNWSELFTTGSDAWAQETNTSLEHSYAAFLRGNLRDQILTFRTDYILTSEPIPLETVSVLPTLRLVKAGLGYYLYAL